MFFIDYFKIVFIQTHLKEVILQCEYSGGGFTDVNMYNVLGFDVFYYEGSPNWLIIIVISSLCHRGGAGYAFTKKTSKICFAFVL